MKDVLVILMFAFGIFAVVMFILFFVYLKKYYNNKHINDDYKKEIDQNDDDEVINIPPKVTREVSPIIEEVEPHIEEIPKEEKHNDDMEFIPRKKK